MKTVISLLIILSCVINGFTQSKKEIAIEKKEKAIELMDNGKPDEAIKLLYEAKALDPDNYEYDYEIGYAYFIKKDYKNAIKIFKKVIKYEDATDQCYQMLGNIYDIKGDPSKAIGTYDKGLEKFPNSGRLFLEKGNVYWAQKKYNESLPLYEKGIMAEPRFPSNYYRAAILYCNSTEEVWGMIYGEIFMNLERNSKRTEEISKLLYDTYKSQITFKGDTSIAVSFSQYATISIDDLKDKELKLPYGVGVYEPCLMLAVVGENEINLNSLNRIRKRFIDNYFSNNMDKDYPNLLFDFQKKLLDCGHLEAYNHWILRKGDENYFVEWMNSNKEKWDAFVDWFRENDLEINDSNKFSSTAY